MKFVKMNPNSTHTCEITVFNEKTFNEDRVAIFKNEKSARKAFDEKYNLVPASLSIKGKEVENNKIYNYVMQKLGAK